MQRLYLFASCVIIHCWLTPSTTFHQYTSAYSFSDLLSNYPSSMGCLTKQDAHPPHQLYLIMSHPPTPQQPTSCQPFMNNVSNSYDSLDYISPCFSPKHVKRLQWGFQLTRNSLFCEHVIKLEYPENILSKLQVNTVTINFIFGSILHTYLQLELLIKTNCLYNICLTINLSKTKC